jgi:hypothetical protein
MMAAACTPPTPTATTPVVVYNSTSAAPANGPSEGFECCQNRQMGDEVALSGSARHLDTVTVDMSDWALSTDPNNAAWCTANAGRCVGNTWNLPVTLNVYAADHTNGLIPAAGVLIGTVTQSISVPWRPAPDPVNCPGGTQWLGAGGCTNGFGFAATFNLHGAIPVVPDDIVLGVSFNTRDGGYVPIGGPTGPYDSLNVLVAGSGSPSVGTDVNQDQIFIDSTNPLLYTDSSFGVGTFREDTGWLGAEPQFKITAH